MIYPVKSPSVDYIHVLTFLVFLDRLHDLESTPSRRNAMSWKFWENKKPDVSTKASPIIHPSAIRSSEESEDSVQAQPIPQRIHTPDRSQETENVDDDDEEEDQVEEDEGENDESDEDVAFPSFEVPSKIVTYPDAEASTAIAIAIGCATPEQVYAKLANYFKEQQISIAQSEDVVSWCSDNLQFIDSEGFFWRPLRPFDVLNEQKWGHDDEEDYDSSDWKSRMYDLPIPTRVLERVAKIIATFGSNVRFYVSDFADVDYKNLGVNGRADIFIMVFPANFTPDFDDEGEDFFYVFDTWSKPGYEDTPKAN